MSFISSFPQSAVAVYLLHAKYRVTCGETGPPSLAQLRGTTESSVPPISYFCWIHPYPCTSLDFQRPDFIKFEVSVGHPAGSGNRKHETEFEK